MHGYLIRAELSGMGAGGGMPSGLDGLFVGGDAEGGGCMGRE